MEHARCVVYSVAGDCVYLYHTVRDFDSNLCDAYVCFSPEIETREKPAGEVISCGFLDQSTAIELLAFQLAGCLLRVFTLARGVTQQKALAEHRFV